MKYRTVKMKNVTSSPMGQKTTVGQPRVITTLKNAKITSRVNLTNPIACGKQTTENDDDWRNDER
jgi:hypothetical protein